MEEEAFHQKHISPHSKTPAEMPEKVDTELGDTEVIKQGTGTPEHNENTHQGFKPRHSQMIAVGGAMGTSLFLGTSQVLRVGGPISLILSYGVLSLLVYCIVTGIAEVATYLPVSGGTMAYYGHKYVSRSMGFAMGYLYWYSIGIFLPHGLVASTLLIDFWHSPINPAVWIFIIYAVIIILNLFPVRAFGECEFWSAGMKIVLIVGLMFLSSFSFLGEVRIMTLEEVLAAKTSRPAWGKYTKVLWALIE